MEKNARRSQRSVDPDIWRREGRPWLLERLRLRDWRQADLIRELERLRGQTVRPGVVSRWTLGQAAPSPEYSALLAQLFGVDDDTVLTLAGHRTRRDEADPLIRNMAATMRQLPPERQQELATYAAFLLERWRRERPANGEVEG